MESINVEIYTLHAFNTISIYGKRFKMAEFVLQLHNFPDLEILNLQKCLLSRADLKLLGGKLLTHCQQLKHFKLCDNNDGNTSIGISEYFAFDVFSKLRCLRSVILQNVGMDDRAAMEVTLSLNKHDKVDTLDLSNNNIGDTFATEIIISMPQNIQHINLAYNKITTTGAGAFIKSKQLVCGSNLVTIDLTGNPATLTTLDILLLMSKQPVIANTC